MAWNKPTRTAAPQNDTAAKPKVDTKVWVNVGYDSIDPRTGNKVFINTPIGIAIDTQNHKSVPNRDSDYRDLVIAKNAFLDELKEIGEDLAPGEELELDLKVIIRRVEETAQEQDTPEKNPHLSNLSRLNLIKKPEETQAA